MKIIVVGSGFSGSILARKIAEELGREVVVLEKRGHIGGNAYDAYDAHGILVQHYGPHYLNTNKYFIIEFLEQYGELFPHDAKLLSYIDGRYVRLPFNFRTVQQLVGAKASESLLAKLRKAFPGQYYVPVIDLAKHADADIHAYGTLLFEKAFRTYISKMWGIQPEEIDPYVLVRSPMVMGFDERYLTGDFQYLPVKGFAQIFEKMLSHPRIHVKLNTDALEHLRLDEGSRRIFYDGDEVSCLVYTGAIDELFACRHGALPYRSLDIRYTYHEEKSALPSEVVSYPQAEGFTRRTEYRKLMFDDSAARGTVVATEYPMAYDAARPVGNIPYYPVVTTESEGRYAQYLHEAEKYRGLFLCGRLAEFKYYNMDICIEHALAYFENVRAYLETCR